MRHSDSLSLSSSLLFEIRRFPVCAVTENNCLRVAAALLETFPQCLAWFVHVEAAPHSYASQGFVARFRFQDSCCCRAWDRHSCSWSFIVLLVAASVNSCLLLVQAGGDSWSHCSFSLLFPHVFVDQAPLCTDYLAPFQEDPGEPDASVSLVFPGEAAV